MIKYWRWSRVIVVYVDLDSNFIRRRVLRNLCLLPGLKRLLPFLENPIFFTIRFHFVKVENGDFLEAAKKVAEPLQLIYSNGGIPDQEPRRLHQYAAKRVLRVQPNPTRHEPRRYLRLSLGRMRRAVILSLVFTNSVEFQALQMGFIELKHWFLLTSMVIIEVVMKYYLLLSTLFRTCEQWTWSSFVTTMLDSS